VDACCPAGEVCCPRSCCKAGQGCCPSSSYCADPGDKCCGSLGTCPSGWNCCGTVGCSPVGGQCCSDGRYCDPGNQCYIVDGLHVCCTNPKCTAHVTGGVTRTYAPSNTDDGDDSTTFRPPVSVPTTATATESDSTAAMTAAPTAAQTVAVDYYFTITWLDPFLSHRIIYANLLGRTGTGTGSLARWSQLYIPHQHTRQSPHHRL
jgi:hypothetical protein